MYTIRKALKIVRNAGFSTVKQDGTWFISKPYHNAACLSLTNGLVTHVWVKNTYDSTRIKIEDFLKEL